MLDYRTVSLLLKPHIAVRVAVQIWDWQEDDLAEELGPQPIDHELGEP